MLKADVLRFVDLRRVGLEPDEPGTSTGRHQVQHLRRGHHKVVRYGPGKSLSRLQWIAPYRAGRGEGYKPPACRVAPLRGARRAERRVYIDRKGVKS